MTSRLTRKEGTGEDEVAYIISRTGCEEQEWCSCALVVCQLIFF